MANIIDELKKDIEEFNDCISGINEEIELLKCAKRRDYNLIASNLENKAKMQKLLDEKIKQLEVEEYKVRTKGTEAEVNKKLQEFNQKNKSYDLSQTYARSNDN